jgi:hypothetical protein
MRTAIIAAALVAAGLGYAPEPAKAQTVQYYPFCLFTGGDDVGLERCNYPTFEQCLYDRQAEGGVCYSNPYPRVVEPARRPARHR